MSLIIRVFLALGGIVSIGTIARAQPATPVVLQVGDARINTSVIQPYKARWKETLVNAINQVIERATWVDEVTREKIDGRDVIVRRVVVTEPDGVERESYRLVVDANTFAPIRSEWKGKTSSYEYEYEYNGTRISGQRVNAVGAAPIKINQDLPARCFDYYGGMMELFLATLPRASGQRFTFPAAIATSGAEADQSAIQWPIVEVQGEENARGAGGAPVKAWRLETNTVYGFYKVWVTDKAPYVVRTVLILAPGGRITYELM